jgi:predicted metal-dependent peptidase
MPNLTLSEMLTYLVSEKNFYATIANSMKRVMAPGLGTMAVGLKDGRVVLYVDPDFFAKISMGTAMFILEHELVHVIMDHIPRYLEMLAIYPDEAERKRAKAIYNIAMDCADNSLLRNNKYFSTAMKETHQHCLEARAETVKRLREAAEAAGESPDEAEQSLPPLPEKAGMVLPENLEPPLPPDRSFEFYQHTLMASVKEGKTPQSVVLVLGGEGSGCDHDMWVDGLSDEQLQQIAEGGVTIVDGRGKGPPKPGDGAGEQGEKKDKGTGKSSDELRGAAEQIRTQLKQILRKAVREMKSGSQGRGLIPAGLAEWLEEYLADPVVPWWDVMRSMIITAKRYKMDRGISKPNRMLLAISEEDQSIIPTIGRLKDPRFRLFFMLDTSGSMDTESLQIMRNELEGLLRADEDMEIRYIHGDCEIHFDQVFKSGDKLPNEAFGRGGTDFDTYFVHMSQYLNNDDTAPDMVIVATDGYAPAVRQENQLPSDVPVVWLLTPRGSDQYIKDYGTVIVCDPAHNKTYEEK